MKTKWPISSVLSLTLLGIIIWGYGRLEVYCYFYPAIDTKFSPGFSEKAFDRISQGMSPSEVRSNLGQPLLVFTNKSNLEEWLFTDDGKCSWGDFAWLWRSIVFSNQSVISITREVRYD
jgi:hypothetical protein